MKTIYLKRTVYKERLHNLLNWLDLIDHKWIGSFRIDFCDEEDATAFKLKFTEWII